MPRFANFGKPKSYTGGCKYLRDRLVGVVLGELCNSYQCMEDESTPMSDELLLWGEGDCTGRCRPSDGDGGERFPGAYLLPLVVLGVGGLVIGEGLASCS